MIDSAKIGSKEIQTAVRATLPDNLGKNDVSRGGETIIAFRKASDKPSNNEVPDTGVLGIFKVIPIFNLLQHHFSERVEEGASMFMTAVLEYLTVEILKISGKISPRTIFTAIRVDKELNQLLAQNPNESDDTTQLLHKVILEEAANKS